MATKTQDQAQSKLALKPIIFYQGEENGIVVETNNYEYSLFIDQYKAAAANFGRIWNYQHSKLYNNKQERDDAQYMLDNKFSNIIAFCGDRGEGKSSCMSSFAKMISEEKSYNAAKEAHIFENIPFSSYDKIELVDPIDPAFFDKKHNVLELLLGRMYQRVKKHYIQKEESNTSDQKLYDYKKLLNQFQKVNKCLSILDKDDKLYDSLEEVADLAVGIQLKEEIDTLFSLYLKFFGKEDGRIVICLDDIDLNMTEAYKMAECVRKYLINLHCIILVAVKVEQLVEVIASSMAKDMDGEKESNDIEEVRRKRAFYMSMAQKYVVKLFPQSNRVDMPSPMDFCNRAFLFKATRTNDNMGANNDNEAKVLMKDFIVRLIYQKTRYVFYNGLELSPIVPRNLRELRHLIAKLYNQEDAWLDDETESNHGREAFHEYFFETWAEKLPNEDYEFAQTLLEYENVTTLNKYILDYFVARVEKVDGIAVKNLGEDENKLYQRISNRNNVAANVSFGDVMYVLQAIDKITTNQDIRNLIFLLKTYYHIRLYALYNQITESEDALFATDGETKAEQGVRIYRNDHIFDGVNALQRLLNGAVFSYPEGCFLPKEKGKKSRDKRHISFDAVRDAFAALRNLTGDEYTKQLRLCEYLALCISGTITGDVIDKIKSVDFDRQSMEIPYLGQFSVARHTAIFDFLYPFYSLCNIKYTYGRFDEILKVNKEDKDILYNLALENKDSILRTLLDYVENARRARASKGDLNTKKVENDENLRWKLLHSLVSDAIIRVTDVQWAISDYLASTREVHRLSNDIGGNIRRAYKDIHDLDINIYSVEHKPDEADQKTDLWKLNFDFLDVLRDALREKSNMNNEEGLTSIDRELAIGDSFAEILRKDDEQSYVQNMMRNMAVMQLFKSFKRNISFPLTQNLAITAILNGFNAHGESRRKLRAVLLRYVTIDTKFDSIDDVSNFINVASEGILMWAAMQNLS